MSTFLVMAVLVSSATANAPATTPETFCQRLAPQLGMTAEAQDAGRNHPLKWHVNLLSGLGPLLFGGHATASFALRPVDENSRDEDKRLDGACSITKKGALCRVEGPAILKVGTKSGKISQTAAPGELADVEMRNTTISCLDR